MNAIKQMNILSPKKSNRHHSKVLGKLSKGSLEFNNVSKVATCVLKTN